MEIRVTVTLEHKDLRAAVGATHRRAQVLLMMIGGALCVEAVVLAAGNGWESPLAWVALGIGAFALLYALVRPALLVRRLQGSMGVGGSTTYTFSEEGVGTDGARGKEQLGWASFAGVVETGRLFLLHPARGSTFLVPKRAFAAPADVEAARALFRSKAAIFRRAR